MRQNCSHIIISEPSDKNSRNFVKKHFLDTAAEKELKSEFPGDYNMIDKMIELELITID